MNYSVELISKGLDVGYFIFNYVNNNNNNNNNNNCNFIALCVYLHEDD